MSEPSGRGGSPPSTSEADWNPGRAAQILRPLNSTMLVGVSFAFVILAVVTALAPHATWFALLLGPSGLALGALLGFVYATLSSEKERFGGVISTINGAIGGAAGADLLRGNGLLATALSHIAVTCGLEHASLVALVLLSFGAVGFIGAYTNKKLWINWQQASTDRRIREIEEDNAARQAGIGGSKGKPPKSKQSNATPRGSSLRTGLVHVPAPRGASGPPSVGSETADAEGERQQEGAIAAAIDPADPQKGQWGGHEASNGRRISATVEPSARNPDLFTIAVTVSSVDPARPLNGDVVLHLHPTFTNQVLHLPARGVSVEQRLLAWGSFTIGAEVMEPEGTTQLELDLATIADAPDVFRSR